MTLKIEIPKGYVIDSFDQKTGEIILKEQPKSITERIKTIDDVLADHGFTKEDFERITALFDEDEKTYRILKMLAKSLNEGWTPDWNNPAEDKYFPWFYLNDGSSGFRFSGSAEWSSGWDVGSRLCYKTRELSDYAGKQFIDVYKQFMLI